MENYSKLEEERISRISLFLQKGKFISEREFFQEEDSKSRSGVVGPFLFGSAGVNYQPHIFISFHNIVIILS